MDDLERLRKERDELEKEDLRREIFEHDVAQQKKERKSLKNEIWGRKHKKTVKVISVAKRSTVGAGMILGSFGKAVGRGAKTMAENYEKNNRPMPKPKKQRVVKVKKAKGKKGSKKKVKVVKVVQKKAQGRPNPFGFNPNAFFQ